jgi:uncharacterized cupredoxin-like copper-binding protein
MTKVGVFISTAVAALALIVTPLATAHTGGAAGTPSTTITVKGGEFFFRLSKKSLATPGAVTFRFTNIGTVAHDFKISGKGTPLVSPGKSATLTVRFKAKGKFPYLCTVPGHAEAGMKGTFTVR